MVRTDDLTRTRDELTGLAPDDVARLVAVARAHGVEAWLAACAPAADGPWAELGAQRVRFIAARARLSARARVLGSQLDAVAAPWAMLKGLSISRSAYPRPDLRHAVDLDVLVPPARFASLVAHLTRLDYRLLDVNWPVLARQAPGQLRLRSADGVLIDLHWHLLNQPRLRAEFWLPTDDLLGRSRRASDVGDLRVLAPVDQLLHVGLHAALSGGNRLIWLVDIDRTIRAEPELAWDAVVTAARIARAGPAMGLVLSRCRRVLGTPVPDQVVRDLGRRPGRFLGAGLVDGRGLLSADPGRPGLSRALARASRSGSLRSNAALVRHGLAWLHERGPGRGRRRGWLDPADPTSALYRADDLVARDAYFSGVAAAAGEKRLSDDRETS
jgi:Uncharacterised nucleotidyltransferase